MNRIEFIVVIGSTLLFATVFGYLFGQKILITIPTPLEEGIIVAMVVISFKVIRRIWKKTK